MTSPADPTPDYPQDAPHPSAPPTPPVSLRKEHGGPPAPEPVASPAAAPLASEPISRPGRPHPRGETTYLPAPTGPSWGTALMGVLFMVVAAGVILNQVNGFQVSSLRDVGPMVLVGAGLLIALVGGIGMVGRRRG